MSHFKRKDQEQLSRQQAAERLTDIAYTLITGGSLKLDDDQQVSAPVADQVMLRRESRSKGDCVELRLKLSWSTGKPAPWRRPDPKLSDPASSPRRRLSR
jgi:amphi-Trp domain-containing protein